MKTVTVNDTSDVHFGCKLTMEVYREQLERVGIELIGTVKMQDKWNRHRPLLDKADLVIVNGEGSIHHGRRQDLVDIAFEYPCVLLNAVYEDNPPNDNIFKFKLITARESESQAELPYDVKIVPDMVFASSTLRNYRKWTKGTRVVGVTDSANGTPGFSLSRSPEKYLETLLRCGRVCAGRFHAIVSCAVLGIPFSAYDSNTHKNQGLMYDMAAEHLYSEKIGDAMQLIPGEFPASVGFYATTAVERIENLFDSLEKYV
jgi:hypothetical protein